MQGTLWRWFQHPKKNFIPRGLPLGGAQYWAHRTKSLPLQNQKKQWRPFASACFAIAGILAIAPWNASPPRNAGPCRHIANEIPCSPWIMGEWPQWMMELNVLGKPWYYARDIVICTGITGVLEVYIIQYPIYCKWEVQLGPRPTGGCDKMWPCWCELRSFLRNAIA